MSYAPATKLSYADASNCATVLTDGYIMITKGLGAGQRMPLADWLIMADGQRIQEEFIPVKPEELVAQRNLAEARTAQAQQAQKYSIGTKFKYTSQDGSSSRTAFQAVSGVLQVSSINNGERDTTKKMYASYAEWQSTLALGGLSSVIYPDNRSKLEKLLSMRSKAPLTDFEVVKELEGLLGISTTVSYKKAELWADRAESARYELSRKKEELGDMGLEDYPKLRMALKDVMHFSRYYANMKLKAKKTKDYFSVKHATTTRIAVRCKGEYNIGPYWLNIVTCPKTGRLLSEYNAYNTLADIHDAEKSENGKPILHVRYRGRYY